jgi:hypothetical protein
MLMESEHSMAREDNDGSGIEMEFMAFISFVGEVFGGSRTEKQTFSTLANAGAS